MDSKAKHTIQTLMDMLRNCIIDFKGNWDRNLSLVEFTYDKIYHSSICMIHFEALCGRIYRSPIGWFEGGISSLFGLELIYKTLEIVYMIRNRLKTDYSRQKSYADHRRRDLNLNKLIRCI